MSVGSRVLKGKYFSQKPRLPLVPSFVQCVTRPNNGASLSAGTIIIGMYDKFVLCSIADLDMAMLFNVCVITRQAALSGATIGQPHDIHSKLYAAQEGEI
jgi:hypothetical protein